MDWIGLVASCEVEEIVGSGRGAVVVCVGVMCKCYIVFEVVKFAVMF